MTDTKTGLLKYSGKYCGCGAKLDPWKLEDILFGQEFWADPQSILHTAHNEDVGAYEIREGVILVQNVDVIAPVVDDAFLFGKIAVNHALNDIYAKGCKPIFAMDILGMPDERASKLYARQILGGAAQSLRESCTALIGGHTYLDDDFRFGLAVIGTSVGRLVMMAGGKPGDKILLTKPIGVGIVASSVKTRPDALSETEVREAVDCMLLSNRLLLDVLQREEIHACTDVSGFGLIGHLVQMASASKCTANLFLDHVPFLRSAVNLVYKGFSPPKFDRHQDYYELKLRSVRFADNLNRLELTSLLYDPQTSGGLLMFVSDENAPDILATIRAIGYEHVSIIGEISGPNYEHNVYVC